MDFRIITSDEQKEILGEAPKRLQFGYFFPASIQTAIGARMILDRYSLGYVPGRVSWMGSDKNMDQKTANKCTEIKLSEKLHTFIKANGITGSSSDVIFGKIDGYQMLATPSSSYGYVYLSFWAV